MFKLIVKTKLFTYEKVGKYSELMKVLDDFYVGLSQVSIEKVK